MGNKLSQGDSSTLGHSTADLSPGQTKAGKQGSVRKNKFLNVFTIKTVGKALSFTRRKKDTTAMQSFQPPLTPGDMSAPLTANTSFAPLDFNEIGKTYKVNWTKDGVLGQGHYATVYRGQNTTNDQMVAVKKVSKKLTRVDSLKTEVEALRKVSGHPNIVNLYDVYLDSDHMYLVLELLAGGELFDRIVQSGAYSERDAAAHMKNIGSALQHMHSKGIVHRDLKPENLVLCDTTPESPIKISDFGLSKILREDEEMMMTICGTKAYSAPEVGFGFRQAGVPRTDTGYSSKVDMWSLGVIIYVIVAAYHPFDPHGMDNDQTIWARIVVGRWDFNDKVWDEMSDSLKDLIKRLIELDPEKRLSAEEFLKHPWINDASTPMRPLPSLTRTRSSKYWGNTTPAARDGNGAGAHKPSKISEALEAEEGERTDVARSASPSSSSSSSSGENDTNHDGDHHDEEHSHDRNMV